MKKLLFFVLFFSITHFSYAVLPDGTTAPAWTAVDLDGNTHDLYTILNSGKHVVIDFSAVWCGPCWNYHNTGTLETLYDLYGPDGTDQIRVFFVEADLSTNEECLYGPAGCNGYTAGNWVAGTPYPIINLTSTNAPNMANDYNVTYYPTIYGISANGTNGVYEIGQVTNISVWDTWLFESFELSATATITDAPCPGEGAIDVQTQNGYGSLSFSWSNGMSGSSISGLDPGMYTVTITDQNGYELEETYEVTGPNTGPLAITMTEQTDVNCYGESTGYIEVSGSGGNGGITYQWSNGQAGNAIYGVPAGDFTVTITDAAGCTATETYTISEPEELGLTVIAQNAECGQTEGSVSAIGFGGTPPFLYDYGVGSNWTGVFNGLAPGDYVMTVTDFNDCQTFETFTISVPVVPVAMASADGVITCENPIVVISGQGSSDGDNISYQWMTGNGIISGPTNEIVANAVTGGTYTLVVTDNDSGCSEEVSVTVEENTLSPAVEIAAEGALDCTNNSVAITATEIAGLDVTYQWSTEDGNITGNTDQSTIEVNQAGTYTVILTNTENGCTTQGETTVTQDAELPQINIAPAETITCSQESVILSADGSSQGNDFEYNWATTDGAIEGNTDGVDVIATAPGSYTLTITNLVTGCSISETVVVAEDITVPEISVNDGLLDCNNTQVELCSEVGQNVVVEWMDMQGNVIGTGNCITVESPGNYVAIATAENGCSNEAEAIVSASNDLPVITIDDVAEITCTNSSVNIEPSLEGNPEDFTFNWMDDSGQSIGAEISITVDQGGTYTLVVTNNETGCTNEMEITVNENIVEPIAGFNFILENGVLTVVDNSSGNPSSIEWSNGSTDSSTELTFDENGTYEVCLTIANDCGEDTYCQDIEYITALTYDVQGDMELCFGENNGSLEITPTGGLPDHTISWQGPNGFSSTDFSITNLVPGDYTMILVDAAGTEKTETFTVVELPEISMSNLSITHEMNDDASGSISFEVDGGSGQGYNFSWSNGANTDTPLLQNIKAGDYEVTVTDDKGCMETFGPFTVDNLLGVSDVDFIASFDVFPNPAKSIFTISLELAATEDIIINVFDIQGKLIESHQYSGKEIALNIDASKYDNGVYIVEIANNNERISKRVIVMK